MTIVGGVKEQCVERLISYWKFNQVFELKAIYKIFNIFLVVSFCLVLFSDDLSTCRNQLIEIRYCRHVFAKTFFFLFYIWVFFHLTFTSRRKAGQRRGQIYSSLQLQSASQALIQTINIESFPLQ